MSDQIKEYEEVTVESITLVMDDDSTQQFAILVVFDVNGKEYAALAPIEEDETIGEDTFFVEYEEDGDEAIISSIDDDETAAAVEAAFDALFEDEE